MKIRYINATGKQRKELVKVISEITGAKSEYLGMPTAAYKIDFFTVTKDGTLEFSDRSDSEIVEKVLEGIAAAGFECEARELPQEAKTEDSEADDDDTLNLTVSMPVDQVNMENLKKLLAAKGNLIKKALGIDELPVEVEGNEVQFPWFKDVQDLDSAAAYTHFISHLCKMSKERTRITATAKEVENEKFAFRCFLLRLGFIGEGFKTTRKILLKNLTGSSAFKNGVRKTAPASTKEEKK